MNTYYRVYNQPINTYSPKVYVRPARRPRPDRGLIDTTNPYDINSIPDVISNYYYKDINLRDLKLKDIGTMAKRSLGALFPAFSLGPAYLKLAKRLSYDPIAYSVKNGNRGLVSNIGAGALQSAVFHLNNLSETMDMVDGSGFIKSAFMKDVSPIDVLGAGGRGRQDAYISDVVDTGSGVGDFLLSMAGEMAASPLTWASFGAKAAGAQGVKITQSAAASGFKKLGLSDDVVKPMSKIFANNFKRNPTRNTWDLLVDTINSSTKPRAGKDAVLKNVDPIDLLNKKSFDKFKIAFDPVQNASKSSITTAQNWYKTLDSMRTIQGAGTKAVWNTTPVPWAFRGVKWAVTRNAVVERAITNTVAAASKGVHFKTNFTTFLDDVDVKLSKLDLDPRDYTRAKLLTRRKVHEDIIARLKRVVREELSQKEFEEAINKVLNYHGIPNIEEYLKIVNTDFGKDIMFSQVLMDLQGILFTKVAADELANFVTKTTELQKVQQITEGLLDMISLEVVGDVPKIGYSENYNPNLIGENILKYFQNYDVLKGNIPKLGEALDEVIIYLTKLTDPNSIEYTTLLNALRNTEYLGKDDIFLKHLIGYNMTYLEYVKGFKEFVVTKLQNEIVDSMYPPQLNNNLLRPLEKIREADGLVVRAAVRREHAKRSFFRKLYELGVYTDDDLGKLGRETPASGRLYLKKLANEMYKLPVEEQKPYIDAFKYWSAWTTTSPIQIDNINEYFRSAIPTSTRITRKYLDFFKSFLTTTRGLPGDIPGRTVAFSRLPQVYDRALTEIKKTQHDVLHKKIEELVKIKEIIGELDEAYIKSMAQNADQEPYIVSQKEIIKDSFVKKLKEIEVEEEKLLKELDILEAVYEAPSARQMESFPVFPWQRYGIDGKRLYKIEKEMHLKNSKEVNSLRYELYQKFKKEQGYDFEPLDSFMEKLKDSVSDKPLNRIVKFNNFDNSPYTPNQVKYIKEELLGDTKTVGTLQNKQWAEYKKLSDEDIYKIMRKRQREYLSQRDIPIDVADDLLLPTQRRVSETSKKTAPTNLKNKDVIELIHNTKSKGVGPVEKRIIKHLKEFPDLDFDSINFLKLFGEGLEELNINKNKKLLGAVDNLFKKVTILFKKVSEDKTLEEQNTLVEEFKNITEKFYKNVPELTDKKDEVITNFVREVSLPETMLSYTQAIRQAYSTKSYDTLFDTITDMERGKFTFTELVAKEGDTFSELYKVYDIYTDTTRNSNTVLLAHNLKIYEEKLSKFMKARMLLTDDGLVKFIDAATQPTKTEYELMQIIDSANTLTDTEKYLVREAVYSFKEVNELHYKFMKNPLTAPFYLELIDTLQKEANTALPHIIMKKNKWIEDVIRDVESQVHSKSIKERYNLDYHRGRVGDKVFNDYAFKKFGLKNLKAHDGRSDVVLVDYLMNEKDSPLFSKEMIDAYKNKLTIIFDTETTTLDGTSGQFYQIAALIRKPNGETVIKNLVFPSARLEHIEGVFLQNKLGYKDIAELKEHLLKTGDLFDSEENLIKEFIKILRESAKEAADNTLGKPSGLNVLGWNSNGFDKTFLDARIKELSTDKVSFSTISGIEFVDMYKEALIHNGYADKFLLPEQKDFIRHQLSSYLDLKFERLANAKRDAMNALEENPTTDVELQNAILNRLRLFDTFHKEHLAIINKASRELGSQNKMFNKMNEFYESINDGLKSIKTAEKELAGRFIVSTDDGLFDMYDNRLNSESAIHVMQLFSKEVGSPYIHVPKTVVEANRFVEFLGLKFGDRIDLNSEASTKFVNAVARYNKRVKNIFAITDFYTGSPIDEYLGHELDNAMEALIDWASGKTITKKPVYLKNLRPNDFVSPKSKFSSLATLYSDLRVNYGLSEVEVKQILKDKVKGNYKKLYLYLENPTYVRAKDLEQPSDYINVFWKLTENDVLKTSKLVDELYESVELINKTDTAALVTSFRERLSSLSVAQHNAGVSGVNHTLQYNTIKEGLQYWENIEDYVGTLNNIQRIQLKEVLQNRMVLESVGELNAVRSMVDAGTLAKNFYVYRRGYIAFGVPKIGKYREEFINIKNYFESNSIRTKLAGEGIGVVTVDDTVYVYLKPNKLKELSEWWKNPLNDLSIGTSKKSEIEYIEQLKLKQRAWKESHKAFDIPEDAVYKFKIETEGGEEVIVENLAKLKESLDYITHGASDGSFGELYNKATHNSILNVKAPPELAHLDWGMFPNDTLVFNRSILGDINHRQTIHKYFSSNPAKTYMNGIMNTSNIIATREKIELFFKNSSLKLGVKANADSDNLFNGLTIREIYDTITKHDDYFIVGLVEDKKFGNLMKVFKHYNFEQFQMLYKRADELQLQVMPAHEYLYTAKAFNDFKITNSQVKFLNEYLIGPMKAGYLSTLGFIFRNIVDTMAKNLILAGPGEQMNMWRHTLETGRLYNKYNEVIKQIETFDDGTVKSTGNYSKRILERYYQSEKGREMSKVFSKDMFEFMHDFIHQGPSAGMSKTQQKAIQKLANKKVGLSPDHKTVYQRILQNPWTANVMSTNSYVEQVFRLSAYTWEIQNGATLNKAMQQVLRVHFDYDAKTKADYYAEYVIPFSAFTKNNIFYWMEVLEKDAYLGSIFAQYYKANWSSEDRAQMEYNYAMQYHYLAGNLMLGNTAVKVNASVMDAVRLLANPEEQLSRVAAYFRVPVETISALIKDERPDILKVVLENIPMIGPMFYRYWNGTVDPSEVPDDVVKMFLGKKTDVPITAGSVWKSYMNAKNPMQRLLAVYAPSIFSNIAMENSRKNIRKTWMRKTYSKYPSRVRRVGRAYTPRPIYAKKHYTAPTYTGPLRDLRSVRNIKNPNIKIGTNRLKSRLMPTTQYSYKSNLRSNWRYVRDF